VYPVPLVLTLRFEKVATPDAAVTVAVPDSDAPPVPVPGVIVSVTLPLKSWASLPEAARASTRRVVMGIPAVV
jgi:hypothetical protein